MTYLLLAGAIVLEVMGTISLRLSDGLSRPVPTVLVIAGVAALELGRPQ